MLHQVGRQAGVNRQHINKISNLIAILFPIATLYNAMFLRELTKKPAL